MTADDHDPDKNPRIKKIVEAVDDEIKRDEDEIEQVEQLAREAKKKLEDGSKWPQE
jgi:hypothetical protein